MTPADPPQQPPTREEPRPEREKVYVYGRRKRGLSREGWIILVLFAAVLVAILVLSLARLGHG